MSNNYDGLSIGQKNTQSRSLDEIYNRWDAASKLNQEVSTSNKSVVTSKQSKSLPTVAVAAVVVALIATVVVLGWPLL